MKVTELKNVGKLREILNIKILNIYKNKVKRGLKEFSSLTHENY